MKKIYFIQGIKMVLFTALAIVAVSYITMLLWNWLMPELFGLTTITWSQAIGILILSKIIFGFGKGKKCCGCNAKSKIQKHLGWKEKIKTRYENMSEEEKSKFKDRCGSWIDCED